MPNCRSPACRACPGCERQGHGHGHEHAEPAHRCRPPAYTLGAFTRCQERPPSVVSQTLVGGDHATVGVGIPEGEPVVAGGETHVKYLSARQDPSEALTAVEGEKQPEAQRICRQSLVAGDGEDACAR